MCEAQHVYLNSNEHKRAVIEVETRDARFVRDCQARYPLHHYHRLARHMHPLRVVKTDTELDLIRRACTITRQGFLRVLRLVKPGLAEWDVEAEFAREFIRRQARFAYPPIIAAGANSCVLHYFQNDQVCRKGQVLLLDVGASYANYNADLTRTIPVGGRFTRRQKQVYHAVLRVLRAMIQAAVPGQTPPGLAKGGRGPDAGGTAPAGPAQTTRHPKTGPRQTRLEEILHARPGTPPRPGRP